MANTFSLSPHTLNLFEDCPRCFWFHVVEGTLYKRPESPASTLPRGMDGLIKKYFDEYRRKKLLPPEIKPFIKGTLVDEKVITKWRSWKTGLSFVDYDGHRLLGALDECLISDGIYIPLDYKTRGFKLKYDSTSYYILQMSCYNFLLHKNNYRISSNAYLVFYIPSQYSSGSIVKFDVEVRKVNTYSPEKVYSIFREAVNILLEEEPPLPSESCSFCRWAKMVYNHRKNKQMRLF